MKNDLDVETALFLTKVDSYFSLLLFLVWDLIVRYTLMIIKIIKFDEYLKF